MNFGQLLCGNAYEAGNKLKRMVSKTVTVTQASMESHAGDFRRLKFLAVKAYGTETQAILDTDAVPNLMSWEFCETLSLAPMDTDRQVTVADRTITEVIGCVRKIPVAPQGFLWNPCGAPRLVSSTLCAVRSDYWQPHIRIYAGKTGLWTPRGHPGVWEEKVFYRYSVDLVLAILKKDPYELDLEGLILEDLITKENEEAGQAMLLVSKVKYIEEEN